MVLIKSQYTVLKHGDRAPDFALPGIDGKIHRLADAKGSTAVLVVFMCNHCPFVKAKLDALAAIHKGFKDKGLFMIGINPNDTTEYPEDDMGNMKKLVAKVPYHYVRDDSQDVARAYGAVCTPDPYLFDGSFNLVYHGRIDDASGPEKTPATADLRNAIKALIDGSFKPGTEKPSMGCSIKWKE